MPHFCFIIDAYSGFRKVEDKKCSHSDKRGLYETFENAIQECEADEHCKGVFDWKCDGRGDKGKGKFQRCISDGEEDAKDGSCFYQKTGMLSLTKFRIICEYGILYILIHILLVKLF